MSETVNLPELGESVTEGTVTRWLKSVGDSIEVDEPLVEVSTDKVDTEIPSPVAGVIQEILVDEDEDIEVGAPLVVIGDGEGSSDSDSDDSGEDSAEEAEESTAEEESAEEDSAAEDNEDSGSDESGSKDSGSKDSGAEDSGEKTEIKLPELGESVTEGTVTRWLKEVGDSVDVDEPLIEVSTDKVDTEVPSPVAGTLLEIKVEEDEDVEVGQVLAVVGSGSASSSDDSKEEASEEPAEEESSADEATEEAAEESKPEAKDEPQEEAQPEPASKEETSSAPANKSAAGYVTPIVRKLANDNGVDLNSIEGTGVGGRIRKQDVEAAIQKQKSASASQPAASAAASAGSASSGSAAKTSSNVPSPEALKVRGTTVKAPRIRQVIASRMRESLDISTQLTQVQEVDMTRIVQLRKQAKASFQQTHGVNLTYLPFITKAVTHALTQIPAFNASYDEEKQEITYHDAEHIGMAVDTERGLLVPVIADAGDLSLAGVAKKIAESAEKARTNKLSPSDLAGSTFSITNIGSVGALFDTPIINQPNVGILGTGVIEKRPRVVTDEYGNDAIAIRHMMYLSLTYDHRLVDGADAGRFLQTVKAQLENAEFASELGL